MRVVVDTNVFVSALISPRGTPAQLLAHEFPFELVTSEEILTELNRVLHYDRIRKRYNLNEEIISGYLSTIREDSQVIEVTGQVTVIEKDPSDNKFLACALEAKADYIVSGDPHLTELETFEGIPIVIPRAFLELLERI
jgi:putative PIN family toxin of toxin-antitoxin system